MSIVIAFATQDRIIVKCDGRELDNKTHNIVSEDTIKYFQITPNCIIGYTGCKNICEQIVSHIANNISVDKNIEPDSIIKLLQIIAQNNYQSLHNSAFLVAGIRYKNNETSSVILGISYQDKYTQIVESIPTNYEPAQITIGSDYIDKIKMKFNQQKSIESNMNDYIREIAKHDNSVNDHISTAKIKLSH